MRTHSRRVVVLSRFSTIIILFVVASALHAFAECAAGDRLGRQTKLAEASGPAEPYSPIRPECMTGIGPGAKVTIGSEANAETVTVDLIGEREFFAHLQHLHSVGESISIEAEPPCSAPATINIHDRGLITVGCPKVWRSERVFSVLDGILRDVDSITLKALQDLDPSSANAAEVVSILNDIQANIKFSQADLANNALKGQQISAVRGAELQQLNQNTVFNKHLSEERDLLQQEDLELQKQKLDLLRQGKKTDDKDVAAIQSQQDAIQKRITAINGEVVKPAISDQSFTGTSAADVEKASARTALKDFPDSMKQALNGLLQAPTLPAAMRMDNVIELLHQRLSREFTVMYDDLARQIETYDLYLVQFDIGVVPRHKAKDREVKVQFDFADKRVLAYELYPGTSSYNIMRGMDKTNRLGISGVAQTLIGLGMAASFNHERNELRSGLSQSLYISGFGAGSNNFGWMIGRAPFENFVSPGNRIVHALILVPKGPNNSRIPQVQVKVGYCWPRNETRYQWMWTDHGEDCTPENDRSPILVSLPIDQDLHVKMLAYDPIEPREIPGSSVPVLPDSNTVQIQFTRPIDPNLAITAGNKVIKRVRDVRGRGIFSTNPVEKVVGTQAEQDALAASRFGLLEKDTFDKDVWLQLSPDTIVMNLSKDTAGTNLFPVITFSDPGFGGGKLTDFLTHDANVRIGEFSFRGNGLPDSIFQPLFTQAYMPGRIHVYVDQAPQILEPLPLPVVPTRLRIISETRRDNRSSPVWLHEHAQVVLESRSADHRKAYPLDCDQEAGSLACDVTNITPFPEHLKIWVDQPPYFGRQGFWADFDVDMPPKGWAEQAYVIGDWRDIRVPFTASHNMKFDHWEASIKLHRPELLNPVDGYCILERPEIAASLSRAATMATNAAIKQPKLSAKLQQEAIMLQDASDDPISVEVKHDVLTLSVPFITLPAVSDELHLQAFPCNSARDESESITLPALTPHLLPGTVVVTDLKNGHYRLEGKNLRSVSHVRLESNGQSLPPTDVSVGLDNVDFFPAKLEAGTYTISVVIGVSTVPLQEVGPDKKLRPASLTVTAPKANDKSDTQHAAEKADTKLEIKFSSEAQSDGKAAGAAAQKTKPASPAGDGAQSPAPAPGKDTSSSAAQQGTIKGDQKKK